MLESLRSEDEDEQWANLDHLLDLDEKYQRLTRQAAWQDFQARLLKVKEDMEARILRGETDRNGNDLTPYLRAAYGVICQVLTIVESIRKRRRQLEQAYMHYDSGEKL
jgi:hypothetical protein